MPNKTFYLGVTLLVLLCGCSSDLDENLLKSNDNAKIRFIAQDFQYANESRTAFNITENGAEFTWGKNDTVGIFPDKGDQVSFPMTSGSGTKTATFDGGGWALKASSTYASYYPFKRDMTLDKTAIPVSYEGQRQVGNGSTSHLGAYDYMAAKATTAENGSVNFNYEHLGCLLQINATLPKACSITSVSFITNTNYDFQKFISKGSFSLDSETPSIVSLKKTNEISLSISDLQLSEENLGMVAYMMIAPHNFYTNHITIKIETESGDIYYSNLENNLTCEAGKAYKINCSLVDNDTFKKMYKTSTISIEPAKNSVGAYLIESASNLKWLNEYCEENMNLDRSCELMTDIIFDNNVKWHTFMKLYSGVVFNGNNHVIENLQMNSTSGGGGDDNMNRRMRQCGLFEIVIGATVKNLTLKNPKVHINDLYNGYYMSGGALVAELSDNSSLINCAVIGGTFTLSGSFGAYSDRVQGFMGTLAGCVVGTNILIKGCYVDGCTISGRNGSSTFSCVGAFIGDFGKIGNTHDMSIISCYTNNLNITTEDEKTYAGSLIGFVDNRDETDCKLIIESVYYHNCCTNYYGKMQSGSTVESKKLEPITETNFSSAISDMNTYLIDCDYKFDVDGHFIKQ